MSLLSELIAEMTALVERSRETRARLLGAGDELERVYASLQGSADGSTSAQVPEGMRQLRGGIDRLAEAVGSLAAGDERLKDYIALLGSAAGAAAGARPPLPAAGPSGDRPAVRGPARKGVRQPTPGRHRLASIRKSSHTADQNTVILPSVDVKGDMSAIRDGRADWNADTNRYVVNGRTWALKERGTMFPVSGPGLVTLSRQQFKALKSLNAAGQPVGIWPKNHLRDPAISSADWDRAAEVYRHHPRHTRGAQ